MNNSAQNNRFWIISLSEYDAHIVEANSKEEVFNNPVRTYRVHHRDLKYKYLDLDTETKREVKRIKEWVDPEILYDPNTTVDDFLSLPQVKNKKGSRKYHEFNLEMFRKVSEDKKQEEIRRYKLAQTDPDKLYQEIRQELEKRGKSAAKEIHNLTKLEIRHGLPQAGYSVGMGGEFPDLDSALDALYNKWEKLFNDPEYLESKKEQCKQIHEMNKKLFGEDEAKEMAEAIFGENLESQ